MATKLQIINSALSKLGAEPTKDFPETVPTKRGKLAAQQYALIRDETLTQHPWKFATKITKLSVAPMDLETDEINITTNIFTKSRHGYATGLEVQLTTTSTLPSPLALSTSYYIIKSGFDTYKLATSLANALAGTAIDITDVGVGTLTVTPQNVENEWGLKYKFIIPPDALRVWSASRDEFDRNAKFDHYADGVVSDEITLFIKYTYQVTDETKFSADFCEMFAQRLASDMSYALVQSTSLSNGLAVGAEFKLKNTRTSNAQQGTSPEVQEDVFLESR